jgi:hypothetical protein
MSSPADSVTTILGSCCDDRFSSAAVQAAVKAHSEYTLMELVPIPVIANGEMQYLRFRAAWDNWEEDVELFDGRLEALTPAHADLAAGIWEFDTEPILPVLLQGTTVDVYAAVATALETREGMLAEELQSFAGQGGSFSYASKGAAYGNLIKRYRSLARISSVPFERVDVA